MKRFINTLKNIWNIKDLRTRILYTLALVLIYRIGSFVVLPGINPADLSSLQDQTKDGVLGLLNMFSGGAFSNASIFVIYVSLIKELFYSKNNKNIISHLKTMNKFFYLI